VMCCSDHRQVLVSEFLFWPRRTPCCLVLDIPIRMICYWTPMRDFWSYYPWLSVVNIYFDPYLRFSFKDVLAILIDLPKHLIKGNGGSKHFFWCLCSFV
jgi:hypothetical protein